EAGSGAARGKWGHNRPEDWGTPPIEVWRRPPLPGDLPHRAKRAAPEAAARLWKTRLLAPPDKGHSILGRQPRPIKSASDFGISPGFHQAVNGGAADVVAPSLVAPFLEGCDGLGEIGGCNADTKHIHLGI